MIGTGTGPELYARARRRIPGGTQLLSKRPEMFLPEQWPSYFSRAAGVHVWDLDGREYVDMSHNAIGANILGAADPDVDAAVINAVQNGVASTLTLSLPAAITYSVFGCAWIAASCDWSSPGPPRLALTTRRPILPA